MVVTVGVTVLVGVTEVETLGVVVGVGVTVLVGLGVTQHILLPLSISKFVPQKPSAVYL